MSLDRTRTSPRCMVCGKAAVIGHHKSHSHRRTKRLVKANIQTRFGMTLCTRCLRTLRRSATGQPRAKTIPPAPQGELN